MTLRFFLFCFFLLLVLISCSEPTTPATVLYFVEQESGGTPYRTRMIITAGFVRMDGGADSEDFLLFDRANGTIYSVSSADQRVLVIRPRPVEINPPTKFTHRMVTDKAAFPSIDGHQVIHYELLTNDTLCYDLFAAAGLLPDGVAALRQYRLTLAGQQALTVPATPPEMRSPCDLANNVFSPARHLEHGFPVRRVDMAGKTSELVDYKTDFRATAAVLRLPADYKRLTIEELRNK